MNEVRLQKFLAENGVASRRMSEELIRQGRVKVNSEVIFEMGTKVTEEDLVEVDGKEIRRNKKNIYVVLNKPCGVVSTSKDQFGRSTVIDLVKDINERIYPIGRLDYDTSGLILMTNDGEFTFQLTHPKHEINKVYIARVKGTPSKEKIQSFQKGLKIEDYITSPAKLKIMNSTKTTSTLEITIHEGKNRQIRKMCDAIGHPVIELKRVSIENINLGNLPEGKWRHLKINELEEIKNIICKQKGELLYNE